MPTESEAQTKSSVRAPIQIPPSAFYGLLLCTLVIASVAIGSYANLLIPNVKSKVVILAAQFGGACGAFALLHWLLEVAVRNNHSMKALWSLRKVRRFRAWLWSGVVFSIGSGIVGNYLYEQAKVESAADVPLKSALAREGEAESSPSSSRLDRRPDAGPAAAEQIVRELPANAERTDARPAAAPVPESYLTMTLFVPTRYRDLQVLVDGEPARVIDRQLSQIKLQVPRRSGRVQFKLQSSLLNKPREFSLQVDHDNFEFSPFQ